MVYFVVLISCVDRVLVRETELGRCSTKEALCITSVGFTALLEKFLLLLSNNKVLKEVSIYRSELN